MKVKIGPYPDRFRCNIYTDYMNKKYGFNWKGKRSKFEIFLEKLEDFIQDYIYAIPNYFLDKRTQKIKVKIDRWDTWSMDHTLAPIILPMLKQLKETKQGAPNVDLDDVPKFLVPSKLEYERYMKEGTTDPLFFKRWDWVMDEMIWAFEQKLTDWEDQYYEWEEDPEGKGAVKIKSLDQAGLEEHQERISNGFRLFGKYYEALWD